jgi:hypothetical protein
LPFLSEKASEICKNEIYLQEIYQSSNQEMFARWSPTPVIIDEL